MKRILCRKLQLSFSFTFFPWQSYRLWLSKTQQDDKTYYGNLTSFKSYWDMTLQNAEACRHSSQCGHPCLGCFLCQLVFFCQWVMSFKEIGILYFVGAWTVLRKTIAKDSHVWRLPEHFLCHKLDKWAALNLSTEFFTKHHTSSTTIGVGLLTMRTTKLDEEGSMQDVDY